MAVEKSVSRFFLENESQPMVTVWTSRTYVEIPGIGLSLGILAGYMHRWEGVVFHRPLGLILINGPIHPVIKNRESLSLPQSGKTRLKTMFFSTW